MHWIVNDVLIGFLSGYHPRCSKRSMMAGFIFLRNNSGIGSDLLAMLLVEVVMCWSFMALV